ncbi:MAG: hypothetical protein ACO3JT_09770, partial [Candidatus Nanopelagicales bacterium]
YRAAVVTFRDVCAVAGSVERAKYVVCGGDGSHRRRNTMTTTCCKCNGTGTINAFGHIAAGVCFLCKGAGTVRVGAADAGTTPSRPGKVASTEMGQAYITRDDVGFVADFGVGLAYFAIRAGRVIVDLVSAGLVGRERDIERALQGALRA